MKILCLLLSFFLTTGNIPTQEENPVKWNFHVEKISDKKYLVHSTALIKEGWHIYAQKQPKDAIATPISFQFKKNPLIFIKGEAKEVGQLEIQEIQDLNIKQYYYSNKVEFIQIVEAKTNANTKLSGSVSFMACTNDRCLPEMSAPFSLNIK